MDSNVWQGGFRIWLGLLPTLGEEPRGERANPSRLLPKYRGAERPISPKGHHRLELDSLHDPTDKIWPIRMRLTGSMTLLLHYFNPLLLFRTRNINTHVHTERTYNQTPLLTLARSLMPCHSLPVSSGTTSWGAVAPQGKNTEQSSVTQGQLVLQSSNIRKKRRGGKGETYWQWRNTLLEWERTLGFLHFSFHSLDRKRKVKQSLTNTK